MWLLALDLGMSLGWAVFDQDGACLASGTDRIKLTRFDSRGMRWIRFRAYLERIREAIGKHEFRVAYEAVRAHKGTDAAHCYGGFVATLQQWCEENEVEYIGIGVADVKRAATGKGNARKEQMIEAARKAGMDPADDNEADAYWVGVAALREFNESRTGETK